MKSNSYFEELELVERLLEDISDEVAEKNEAIYEDKKRLEEYRDAFKKVISKDIGDSEFQTAYENLSNSYISLEYQVAPYISKYRHSFSGRLRVLTCFNSITDTKSGVVRYMLLLNNDIISSQSISVLNRLVNECKTISFYLDEEEGSTLKLFEEYLGSI